MLNSKTQTTRAVVPAPSLDESSLTHTIHAALHKSPYLSAKTFQVEAGEGHVRLEGEVGSFYEKQMAQETVLRIDGVERVENLLQVAWA